MKNIKKIISLILIIATVAAFCSLSASADDYGDGVIVEVDASCPEGQTSGAFTESFFIEKKYFAVSYTLYGLPQTAGVWGDNGCCGIQFDNYESASQAYVFICYNGNQGTGVMDFQNKVWFGPWWNNSCPAGAYNVWLDYDPAVVCDQDMTIVCYGSFIDDTLTIKTEINGEPVNSWGLEEFSIEGALGYVDAATKVSGLNAKFKFVESDSPLDADVFVNGGKTAPVTTENTETEAPTTTETPVTEAPTTTDAPAKTDAPAETTVVTENNGKVTEPESNESNNIGLIIGIVAAVVIVAAAVIFFVIKKKRK